MAEAKEEEVTAAVAGWVAVEAEVAVAKEEEVVAVVEEEASGTGRTQQK